MSIVAKLRNHCIDGEEKVKDPARATQQHVRSKAEEEELAKETEKVQSGK